MVYRLLRNVAVALAVPSAVVWLFFVTFFPISADQRGALAGSILAAVTVVAIASLVFLRRKLLPIAAALEQRRAAKLAKDTAASAAPAQSASADLMFEDLELDDDSVESASERCRQLPAQAGFTMFALWSVGMAAVAPYLLAHGIASDVLVAGGLVAVSAGVMTALLEYYVVTAELVPALEQLGGQAETRARTTVRTKVIAICFASLFLSTTLIGATSYVRYREESEQDFLDFITRVQDGAVFGLKSNQLSVIEMVYTATGSPTHLQEAGGQVLASFGAIQPLQVTPEAGTDRGRQRVQGGWQIFHRTPSGAYLVSFVDEELISSRRSAFWRSVFLFALCVFCMAGYVVFAAARTITEPMQSLGRAADRIAAGDLTVMAASVSRDEVGQLAGAFGRMALGLKNLLADVHGASLGVTEGAKGMGEIGDRVKTGALAQRAGVSSVNASVEAMGESISLVWRDVDGLSEYVASTSTSVGQMATALFEVRRQEAELEKSMIVAKNETDGLASAGRKAQTSLAQLENLAVHASGTLSVVNASLSGLESAANDSAKTASQVADTSERAASVVNSTIAGIEKLRSTVGDAQKRVTALGRRSEDINQIVDFIADVAGRTNLLSLNASIIAAQAGEHGKAFAVVANQIRELASQIASSTKSIGDIIQAVRADVDGTAMLIGRGDSLAADGVRLARNSGEALRQIREAIAQARETAASIQSAVQAHVQSSREVSELVGSVATGSKTVTEAVALVGRSVAAVGAVGERMRNMADKVGRALDEQSSVGRQQLESLEKINSMIAEITRAVQDHNEATLKVRNSLRNLGHTAEQHESAVDELSVLADRLWGRARALVDCVARFKVHG